jgi:hypothetical protein
VLIATALHRYSSALSWIQYDTAAQTEAKDLFGCSGEAYVLPIIPSSQRLREGSDHVDVTWLVINHVRLGLSSGRWEDVGHRDIYQIIET